MSLPLESLRKLHAHAHMDFAILPGLIPGLYVNEAAKILVASRLVV